MSCILVNAHYSGQYPIWKAFIIFFCGSTHCDGCLRKKSIVFFFVHLFNFKFSRCYKLLKWYFYLRLLVNWVVLFSRKVILSGRLTALWNIHRKIMFLKFMRYFFGNLPVDFRRVCFDTFSGEAKIHNCGAGVFFPICGEGTIVFQVSKKNISRDRRDIQCQQNYL